MKRFIALTLALLLVVSLACADSAQSMLWKFNFNAETYGAKQLDNSMITEDTEQRIVFTADNATIAFASTNNKSLNSALVICADEAEFLPYCICATMCIDPSTDNVLNSFGNVLYCYLNVRAGKESDFGFFGGYLFNIRKDGDNYRFVIGEQ